MQTTRPQQATKLPVKTGARVALCTAHPDDAAVLLSYAALSLAHNEGELWLFTATDGEASTLGDTHFVATLRGRRTEEVRSAERMGIAGHRVYFAGLADGQLQPTQLALTLKAFVVGNRITTVITLGADGCDNHPDHIAVHQAVRALNGVDVLSLNTHGTGRYKITGDPTRKLACIAEHASQFPGLNPHAQTMPAATQAYLDHYEPFLTTETYDHFTSKSTIL